MQTQDQRLTSPGSKYSRWGWGQRGGDGELVWMRFHKVDSKQPQAPTTWLYLHWVWDEWACLPMWKTRGKADADFAKLTQGDSNLHDKLAFGVDPIVKKNVTSLHFGVGKNLHLLWGAAKVQIRTVS